MGTTSESTRAKAWDGLVAACYLTTDAFKLSFARSKANCTVIALRNSNSQTSCSTTWRVYNPEKRELADLGAGREARSNKFDGIGGRFQDADRTRR